MTAPLAGQPVIAGPSSDQPIMYQMPPGQLQPMSPGMPTVSAQGQPGVQYYISAGGQPVQHVPQVQPIPQIVHPIPGQGIPNNLAQHHDPEMAPIRFNKAYMKSALGVSRVLEFVSIIVPLFWRKLHLTSVVLSENSDKQFFLTSKKETQTAAWLQNIYLCCFFCYQTTMYITKDGDMADLLHSEYVWRTWPHHKLKFG